MRARLKTKRGMQAMMICGVFSLMGCESIGAAPAFKDIQRAPPVTKPETAEYLLANDRRVGVWIAETAKKCKLFGCIGAQMP